MDLQLAARRILRRKLIPPVCAVPQTPETPLSERLEKALAKNEENPHPAAKITPAQRKAKRAEIAAVRQAEAKVAMPGGVPISKLFPELFVNWSGVEW